MALFYVDGDPLLTRAQTLAFGHNARGRTELGKLETVLLHRFPTAFAAYGKGCRSERIKAGGLWIWRESHPHLAFLTVRESAVGATRLRFVQSALMRLGRDYRLEGVKSVALAPLGDQGEWHEITRLLPGWLGSLSLPVIVYRTYQPGVRADEPDL